MGGTAISSGCVVTTMSYISMVSKHVIMLKLIPIFRQKASSRCNSTAAARQKSNFGTLPLLSFNGRMNNPLISMKTADLTMRFRWSVYLFCCCLIAVLATVSCAGDADSVSNQIDREYVLNAKMIGYTGVGGDIDGRRNPVLRAKKGERVKISLVNG